MKINWSECDQFFFILFDRNSVGIEGAIFMVDIT